MGPSFASRPERSSAHAAPVRRGPPAPGGAASPSPPCPSEERRPCPTAGAVLGGQWRRPSFGLKAPQNGFMDVVSKNQMQSSLPSGGALTLPLQTPHLPQANVNLL